MIAKSLGLIWYDLYTCGLKSLEILPNVKSFQLIILRYYCFSYDASK